MKQIMMPYFYQTREGKLGFSLTELVIGLGIFSFILIGLMTLITHMDQKEEWLKSRATTHAELDATLQTIEKFWDRIDWETLNSLSVESHHKKFTLTRPINMHENESLTVSQACQRMKGLPKELATTDAKLISGLQIMKKCGSALCPKGALPVVKLSYLRSGKLTKRKFFPQSAKSNTFLGSTLGIGMCAFPSSDGERLQIELEGIFFSRHEKAAPFRKMTMFRTLTKGNRIGDDVKLFEDGDSL